MFQSAGSGKAVTVSEEALSKANKLLANIDADDDDDNVKTDDNAPPDSPPVTFARPVSRKLVTESPMVSNKIPRLDTRMPASDIAALASKNSQFSSFKNPQFTSSSDTRTVPLLGNASTPCLPSTAQGRGNTTTTVAHSAVPVVDSAKKVARALFTQESPRPSSVPFDYRPLKSRTLVQSLNKPVSNRLLSHRKFVPVSKQKVVEAPKRLSLAEASVATPDKDAISHIHAYLERQGIEPGRVTVKWIHNHYRWLVWKFTLEQIVNDRFQRQTLSLDRISHALHRRYTKEQTQGNPSVIRKILNRDMASSAMIILHVVSTHKNASNDLYGLILTDGWYFIRGLCDSFLSSKVDQSIILPGGKLLVSNAILVGCDDGIDPLDEDYDTMKPSGGPYLRLFTNSTRWAMPRSPLGLVPPRDCIDAPHGRLRIKNIADVKEGGGSIPCIDLCVIKRFPLLFMEKYSGGTLEGQKCQVLTEAEENDIVQRMERDDVKLADQLIEQVEGECTEVIHVLGTLFAI
jgi:hypothetical protein